MPQVQNVFAIVGFSILDSVNEPNTAFVVPTLKPFADRVGTANSAQALIRRVFGEGQQVRTATIIPFNLPPIIGLSTTGGFEYELEALEGQEPAAMNSVMLGLVANANRDPQLTRVFSTYTASNPSIYLDIDREKTQALGLGMNDVFTALQATMGGIYINNFNLFGRVWQVNIQGEAADRSDVPGRVVVSEYVDVANAFVDREETGLVNAVLDQLARKFRAAEFEHLRSLGDAAAVAAAIPDNLVDELTAAGTPAQTESSLRRVARTGVDAIAFGPVGPDPDEQLRLFASAVVPLLRAP